MYKRVSQSYLDNEEQLMSIIYPGHEIVDRVGWIYYFTIDEWYNKYVKIGYSKDVVARKKKFETGLPQKIVVLAVHPGTTKVETALHMHFKEQRLQREWFRKTGPLHRWLNRIHCEDTLDFVDRENAESDNGFFGFFDWAHKKMPHVFNEETLSGVLLGHETNPFENNKSIEQGRLIKMLNELRGGL